MRARERGTTVQLCLQQLLKRHGVVVYVGRRGRGGEARRRGVGEEVEVDGGVGAEGEEEERRPGGPAAPPQHHDAQAPRLLGAEERTSRHPGRAARAASRAAPRPDAAIGERLGQSSARAR